MREEHEIHVWITMLRHERKSWIRLKENKLLHF